MQKGTVTKDITKAVKEAKQGVPFKKDKTAIVHVGIGKVHFASLSSSSQILKLH